MRLRGLTAAEEAALYGNSQPSGSPQVRLKGLSPEEEELLYGRSVRPTAQTVEDPSLGGEFAKGLSRGVKSTGALIAGGAGQVGSLLGADDFSADAMAKYDELMAEAEASPAAISSVEDINSVGDFMLWSSSILGEQVPTIASLIASGGLGGLVTKVGLKVGSRKLAEEAIKRATARGVAGGAFAGSTLLGTGEVGGELHEIGEDEPGLALGFGAAIGTLDVLPIMGLMRQVGLGRSFQSQFMKRVAGLSRVKQAAVMAPIIGTAESGTEALQELLAITARDIVDENYEFLGEESSSRILNAAAGGLLVGGVLGGGASVVSPMEAEAGSASRDRREQRSGLEDIASTLDLEEDAAVGEEPTPATAPVAAAEEKAHRRQRRGQKRQVPNPVEELYPAGDPKAADELTPPTSVDEAPVVEEPTPKPEVREGLVIDEQGDIIVPHEPAPYPFSFNDADVWADVLRTAREDGRSIEDVEGPSHGTLAQRERMVEARREKAAQQQKTPGLSVSEKNRLARLEAKETLTAKEQVVYDRLVDKRAAGELALSETEFAADPVGFYAEDERGTLYGPFKSKGEADVWTEALQERPGARSFGEIATREEFQEVSSEWAVQSIEDAEAIAEAQGRDLTKLWTRAREGKTLRSISDGSINRSLAEEREWGKQVAAVAQDFARRHPLAPQIQIVRFPSDGYAEYFSSEGYETGAIDENLQRKLRRAKGLHRTFRDRPGESIVYLNVTNQASVESVERTLLHEIVAHDGLFRFMEPAQKQYFLDKVAEDLDLELIRNRYHMIDPANDRGRQIIAEEYVARLAEDYQQNLPTWRRVLAIIRRTIRRMFPKLGGRLTDDEIRLLLRNMHIAYRGQVFGQNQPLKLGVEFAPVKPPTQAKKIEETFKGTAFWSEGKPKRLYASDTGRITITPDHELASGRVVPVYVRARKVLNTHTKGGVERLRELSRKYGNMPTKSELQNEGYDALLMQGVLTPLGNNQVYSAFGELRQHSPSDFHPEATESVERVMLSVADDNTLSPEGQEAIASIEKLASLWKVRAMRWFMTPLQIGKLVPLKSVQDYLARTEQFWNTKMAMITEADAIVTDWRQMGKSRANRLSKVLFEANELSEEKKRRLTRSELEELFTTHELDQADIEMYTRIDSSFRQIVRRVELSGIRTTLRETVRGKPAPELEEAVVKLYDSNADSTDMDTELKKLLQGADSKQTFALASRLEQMREQMNQMKRRNYFPHLRFGAYTLTAVARQDMKYDGKTFKKGKLVVFETTETSGAQATRKAELEKELGSGVVVKAGKLEDNEFSLLGFPPLLFESMKKELGLSERQQRVLEEIYFRHSPGKRFLKSLTRRRGVAGYSQDAMRVYAAYMMNAANHVARIEHRDDLLEAVKRMQSLSKGKDPDGSDADLPVTNLTGMAEMRDYFARHYNYLMNPGNDLAKLRAMGFLWYLGASPKSAFVNMTQVPMVTYPWLAARFGDASSVRSITKAYKDVVSLYRKNGGNVDELEREMLHRGVEEGWIDESLATELAGIAEAPAMFRMLPGDTGSVMINKVSYYGAFLFHQAEKFNRRVAALAAFRLEMRRSGDAELAHQQAKAAVQATQFEYAKWNRAAFMRGKSSVFFLFWQFMQQASFLAFGGEGRGTAVRMWLMLLTMAGAQGLPFAENAMDLFDFITTKMKSLLGMKDPHNDVRTDIRELVQEMGANPDLVMHGLSRYYGLGPMHLLEALGVPVPNTDVSGSLSMGRVLPGMEDMMGIERDPDKRLARFAVEAGGPIVGIGYNWWRMIFDDEPDSWKRVERGLPTLLKNLSKGVRYQFRDEENLSTGATVFDFADLPSRAEAVAAKLAQTAGFMPTQLAQAYEKRAAQEQTRKFWLVRRALMMQNYGYAQMTRDREGVKDARQAIAEYNRTVPSIRLRITREELKQSLAARRRGVRLQELGLPNEKRLQRMYQAIGEAYPVDQ